MNEIKCKHYDKYTEQCYLCAEESDEFDGTTVIYAKCKNIANCEYKARWKNEYCIRNSYNICNSHNIRNR